MAFTHRRRRTQLIISLVFLLISSSTHVRYMAEGRALSDQHSTQMIGEEEKAIVRSQIGSRPPRCDRRCNTCGHCEAVQVPAVPQENKRRHSFSSGVSVSVSMRGEDGSNYKPMSWKCKCGDIIFNP